MHSIPAPGLAVVRLAPQWADEGGPVSFDRCCSKSYPIELQFAPPTIRGTIRSRCEEDREDLNRRHYWGTSMGDMCVANAGLS